MSKTITCPECSTAIYHVEISDTEQGVMYFGHLPDFKNHEGFERQYFCPNCLEEIDELLLLEMGVIPGE